jgi:PIN domain nuclease of toxin-antitoxin system
LKLLLDTHIWLWSKLEPKRLGRKLLSELSDVNNELWLSRIQVDDPFAWIERAAEQMREAPLTREIVSTGLALPLLHADPADRFLAGTAKVLKLTLVTADQKLLGLGEIATLNNR